MTPEQELELLIEEQRKDDASRTFWPQRHTVSLDKEHGFNDGGGWSLYDLTYVDEDGYAVVPRAASRAFRRFTRERHPFSVAIPHGTLAGYTNLQCRCQLCRATNAAYRREHYLAKPLRTGTCPVCEVGFETNQDAKVYCSQKCNKAAWNKRNSRSLKAAA